MTTSVQQQKVLLDVTNLKKYFEIKEGFRQKKYLKACSQK